MVNNTRKSKMDVNMLIEYHECEKVVDLVIEDYCINVYDLCDATKNEIKCKLMFTRLKGYGELKKVMDSLL